MPVTKCESMRQIDINLNSYSGWLYNALNFLNVFNFLDVLNFLASGFDSELLADITRFRARRFVFNVVLYSTIAVVLEEIGWLNQLMAFRH